jgi:hypothetical protein
MKLHLADKLVMAGPVPASTFFLPKRSKTWMPGTRPGMTSRDHKRSRMGVPAIRMATVQLPFASPDSPD